MRLSFYAGLVAFALTATTQAIQLDTTEDVIVQMGQVDAGSETDQVSLVKPTKAQVKLDNSHVTKAKKEEAVLTKKPKVSDKGKAVKVDPSKSAKVERKDTKN